MLISFYKIFKEKMKLRKYDDFSIGDYFRSQGAQIGKDNRILIRSLGESPRLISIGDHCTISFGVSLLTHDGAGWIFTEEIPSLQKFGTIKILDNCFIGAQAILLPNIKIGPNAVVGAGAVVSKDVGPGSVVAGNPAKIISSVDELKEKMIQSWSEQRPPGYLSELQDGTVVYSPKIIQRSKQQQKNQLDDYLVNYFKIAKG